MAPSSDKDLVDQIRALRPLLRDNAARTERAGRVVPEVLEALAATGIHRMNVPHGYGGYQTPLGTQLEALAEIAAACGSTAWTTLIHAGCAYIAALFPAEARDEIFSNPGVRVSGTLSPTATAVPRGGDYVVSGVSPFATGCQDADWHLLAAAVPAEDGPPELLWAAVPVTELDVLDDWHVSGLAGSGSNSVVADGVVVPAHRTLSIASLMDGPAEPAAEPFYRMPVLSLFCAWTAPEALGLARGALSEFLDRIHRRGITYTFYDKQADAAVTHLQAGEAALKISCAELLTGSIVDTIESKAAAGEPYTVEERARIRAQCGYLTRLCKEAIDLVASAAGASAIHLDAPIQRIVRDVHALSVHSLVNPATNLELYGRVLAGREPNTALL
jgi:alkylation response protein AidB-like acyl-CoA dehydrogenase